jgi:prophage regulatory protein
MHDLKVHYYRLKDIIGDGQRPGLLPISKTTWWDGVRSGRFPKSWKPFGGRITCWKAEDIHALLNKV